MAVVDNSGSICLPADDTFRNDLVSLLPHLRAFARSLARGPGAEDLAQDAVLNAWRYRASFQPGTSLKAWTFTILRNTFLSEKRRSWRSQPLDRELAENTLLANDDPTASEELLDVRNAMQVLPHDQRQALMLVGAAQLSYEETASICRCAVGTIKSRVSRARTALAEILAKGSARHRTKSDLSSTNVFEAVLRQAADVRSRVVLEQPARIADS
jgi:RNA polymerase sigma-70 factor (ECF subfamily)